MRRSSFIKASGLIALSQFSGMNTLSALEALGRDLPASPLMPVMFIGHGSPMNVILKESSYYKSWQALGKSLPRPKAILSISAHWLTPETRVSTTAHPDTIHDFGGFPKELFLQEYLAPGSPEYAKMTKDLVTYSHIQADDKYGLDHGTWCVLKPMYPLADIPVFQLGIVYEQTPQYHYEIGKQLAKLREKGVLIIGSGNLVHNLQLIDWNGGNKVYDWAQEFDEKFTGWISSGDYNSMLNYKKILGTTATMAHPTNDHLLPLFYILGLQQKNEQVSFFNNQFDMASISMRSFVSHA